MIPHNLMRSAAKHVRSRRSAGWSEKMAAREFPLVLLPAVGPMRQMIRSAAARFFTMDMGRNEAAAKAAVKPSFGKNEKEGARCVWPPT